MPDTVEDHSAEARRDAALRWVESAIQHDGMQVTGRPGCIVIHKDSHVYGVGHSILVAMRRAARNYNRAQPTDSDRIDALETLLVLGCPIDFCIDFGRRECTICSGDDDPIETSPATIRDLLDLLDAFVARFTPEELEG